MTAPALYVKQQQKQQQQNKKTKRIDESDLGFFFQPFNAVKISIFPYFSSKYRFFLPQNTIS